jgi:hypothetical protein
MRALLRSLVILAGLVATIPTLSGAQGTRGVQVQRAAPREVGARRVLIVGVDKYSDQRIPQLRYATVDAMAFAGWLRSPAAAARVDTMIILLNEQATREAVLDTYRELVAETKENDELIVYFAGHGGVREVHGNQEGYLLPHDADSSNIARRGISLDDINKEVSYLPGQSPVLLILDACRSGNLFNSNLMSRAAESLGPNIRRLVSSEGSQDSQEGEQWRGHGAFTYFLLNGLYGMADISGDGNVTLAELGLWVVDRVSSETNQQQIPQVQPFDHKWVIAPVNQRASDSVAALDAARPRARGLAAAPPTRGVPAPARPAAGGPPAGPVRPAAPARAGGVLTLGQRVSARLEASAPVLDDSTHFDTWTYTGRRGDKIAIVMRSSQFDPFLILSRQTPAGRQTVRTDDDGGGGTDAQISLQLPADGEYVILANAVAKTDLGDYTLEVQSVAQVEVSFSDVLARAADLPAAPVGAVTTGSLTDNSQILTDKTPFEPFAFDGRAGETVEIEMRTTDFDAYLAVAGVGIDSVLARDDDSGNNLDALVVVTLPRTGRYVVLANAIGRDARGAFELDIRRTPPSVRSQALLGRTVPSGQRIRKDQQIEGDLRRANETMEDNSRFEVYYYEGRANEKITITMRSDEFDTYLHIGGTGPLGMRTLWEQDDDSGGGTDSRLTVTLPMDGVYAIIANAVYPRGRGPYTLSVRDGNSVDLTSMTDKDVISQARSYPRVRIGQSVRGQLTDNSPVLADETPFQGYTLEGRAGQTVQIDMRTTAFDAFLTVGMVGTDSILGRNDDGGEDTNAQLTVTLPADGQYVIFANAIEKDARGEFTLELTAGRELHSTAQILAMPARADRRLRAGQPMSSQITGSLPLMSDRTPYEVWYIEGRAGEQVTVTMRSSDFDAYLHIGKVGAAESLATDDDSGGDLDAQVSVTLPTAGTYAVIANTVAADASGAYTITLGDGAAPAPRPAPSAGGTQTIAQILAAPVAPARRLSIGQTQVSRLTASSGMMPDNTPFETWYLEGRAGTGVTITMRSSEFDSFLHVGARGGSSAIATDDDSGGDLDSRVTTTIPAGGVLVIVANTVGEGESGAYSLEVTEGAAGPAPAPSTDATLSTVRILGLDVASDRRIRVGETRTSSLSGQHPMMSDNTPFETWYLEGRSGDRITVTMRSSAMDTYLHFGRQGASETLATDDDSGGGAGGTDAQVTVTLPANGTYVIIANVLSEGSSGAYTLEVRSARSGDDSDSPDVLGLGAAWTGGWGWSGELELQKGQAAAGPLTTAQILALPVARDRTIARDETRASSLDAADRLRDDDSYFEAWYVSGRAGERITVTMRSDAFDAFLLVGRQGASEILDSNDDDGGGTDARVTLELPADGDYVIIANSLTERQTGEFTLTVTTGSDGTGPQATAAILAAPVNNARRIAIGQTQLSRLTASSPLMSDDSPYETWYLEGRAGQEVTITMRSSDFDAFLHIGLQGGDASLSSDDDSGGDLDARITITLPSTGTYVIIANTVSEGESGAYSVEVSAGAGGTPSGTLDAAAVLALPVEAAQRIRVGETRTSQLGATNRMMSDNTPFETWYLEGRAGERITITMKSSAFDSYLRIGAHGAGQPLESDDDSGGDLDAQITITLPSSGVFVLIANTLSEGESGSYTIAVSRAN